MRFPESSMKALYLSLAIFAIALLAGPQIVGALNSTALSGTATPIKHIVFLIQENHTYDNMFGVYPGTPNGYGLNVNICVPQSGGGCVKPFNADNLPIVQATDIPHTSTAAHMSYSNGAMNGFVNAAPKHPTFPMAYYTGKVIPNYWDLAQYYSLNDLFMSSALSFSLPNHLYTVAAQAGMADKCTGLCQTPYNLTFADIGTAMTKAGVSWGYYQYNWNDKLDCTGEYTRTYVNSNTHGGYDGFWSGEADFRAVQLAKTSCSSLLNYNDLQNAISSNTLPGVSWIIPQPSTSEHPQQSTWAQGQAYTTSVINAIEQSPAWSSTVIYLTWDDYGGYYDGVVPMQIDQYGMGMRVPLIAISPYSIQGQVLQAPQYSYGSGQTAQEDFSAFLSTIEYNWHLSPLTHRDAVEPNLFYMLNFNQAPLKTLVLGSSGVVYPYTTCVAQGHCSFASPAKLVQLYSPPVSATNESVSQALNNSGTDATD
ncbi:MAG: phospholipase C [Nitrososphaerales archaeon]